jgi:hypothetical protein
MNSSPVTQKDDMTIYLLLGGILLVFLLAFSYSNNSNCTSNYVNQSEQSRQSNNFITETLFTAPVPVTTPMPFVPQQSELVVPSVGGVVIQGGTNNYVRVAGTATTDATRNTVGTTNNQIQIYNAGTLTAAFDVDGLYVRSLNVTGNTALGGTLNVTGSTTLSGNTTVGGTFGVNGATSLNATSVSYLNAYGAQKSGGVFFTGDNIAGAQWQISLNGGYNLGFNINNTGTAGYSSSYTPVITFGNTGAITCTGFTSNGGLNVTDASSSIRLITSGGTNYIQSGNTNFTAAANLVLCGHNNNGTNVNVNGNLSVSGSTTLSGSTTNSGTISGGTIFGCTLSGNTTNSGTISGGTISGGTISGCTISGDYSLSITPAMYYHDGSRMPGNDYRNWSKRPMIVTINASSINTTNWSVWINTTTPVTSGVKICFFQNNNSAGWVYTPITFVVPPLWYYRADTNGYDANQFSWVENSF